MSRIGTTRTWVTAGVAALLITAAAGAVGFAQPPGPPDRPFMGGRMGRPGGMGGRFGLPLGQLNLTDAQHEQVKSIVQGHQEELQQVAQRTREARMALRQAELADTVNEAAIRTASEAVHAAMTDGAVLRAKLRAEVLQVLTPEQRAKAAELRTQAEQRMQLRQQRMQERRQRWQQGQPKPGAVGEY